MKLETPIPVVRPRAVALLWALLVLPLASCLKLGSSRCADGLTCPDGTQCAANESVCISTPCGDGIVQADEQCDDGNLRDNDGCSRDCRSNEICGNGKLDVEAGEVCDDGNKKDGDGCSADCRSNEQCGNGHTDLAVGEDCDDGNKKDGDGCSAKCDSQEKCGNGHVDSAVGETCDDGNQQDGDNCGADCRSGTGCGNGILSSSEACDDGNGDNDDDCLKIGEVCVVARCGDGFTDAKGQYVEQCDDKGESEHCNLNCTLSSCGDGIVNGKAHEQCDTGGESSTCNSNCSIAYCGDGILNSTAGEECDEGAANGRGNCLATCKINKCGDGTHQPDREVCDDGNTDACGQCDPTCMKYQLTDARGSITAVEADLIGDGDTFSLSDGIRLPQIFEFDKNGKWEDQPDRVRVVIWAEMSAQDVAQAIKSAVNYDQALAITAEVSNQSSRVTLKNVTRTPRAGAFGNQHIVETVANSGFKVEGMAGGGASDCPVGTHCKNGEDCASGFCDPASGWICRQ